MRRAQRFAQLPTQTHQASGQQPQGLPLRRGHDAFHEKRIHEEEEELIKEVALCASSGRCGRSLAAGSLGILSLGIVGKVNGQLHALIVFSQIPRFQKVSHFLKERWYDNMV